MSKVFVTRPIPDSGLNLLKSHGHQVMVLKGEGAPTQKHLIKALKGQGYEAIISVLTEKINAGVLDAAGSKLKIVANYAVGFDNVDVAQARKRGVFVTNTPGDEISESVGEFAMALLLAVARKIVPADKFIRGGKYKAWGPFMFLGSDVCGRTLGVVGLGRIGTALVRRAVKGFGMKVCYYDVKPNAEFEKEFGAKFMSLIEVLRASDFVSVHVPLLPSTRHLIGAQQLAIMKPTAYLINTSRGPVIDEKALVAALRKNMIAGAALDVYEFEPKLATGLVKLENVLITPHIASATEAARQAMSLTAAKNVVAALAGQVPPNLAK